jgi:cytochrome c553
MKRSGPLKRRTPLKRAGTLKRTRINRVSKTKAKQDRRLSPLRAHYRDLGNCCLCNGWPVEIHEIAARSKSKKSVEYPDNWLRLCGSCHESLQHTNKADQVIVKLHHVCAVIVSLCSYRDGFTLGKVMEKLTGT